MTRLEAQPNMSTDKEKDLSGITENSKTEKEDYTKPIVSLAEKMSFVNLAKSYYRYRTDAPVNYGEITSIQILGHAIGREPINMIQPYAVHHNMYVLLDGESTYCRKSTAQELGKMIYPQGRTLPNDLGSPESFLEQLSEQQEAIKFLGEFSGLLKGINSGGYMARFAEIFNDISDCTKYHRKLRTHKKSEEITEWLIEKPYLSLHSTITPEVLQENINVELSAGGMLPRWLIVKGIAKPKPRGRLTEDAIKIGNDLRAIVERLIELDKTGTVFEFSDSALEYFNKVVEPESYKFRFAGAFGGRYQNYVVAIADILMVSDAIGIANVEGIPIASLGKLVKLVQLVKLVNNSNETIDRTKDTKRYNSANLTNPTNYDDRLIVPRIYVERAWQIVKPCLEYTAELVAYVEMGKELARVRRYIKEHGSGKNRAYHSEMMRAVNISKKKAEEAIETLYERKEIESDVEPASKICTGRQYSRKYYVWKDKE